MELKKETDTHKGSRIITLIDEDKTLKISQTFNGDLNMAITEGRKLDNKYGDHIYMDVRADDGHIYDVFYNLYGRIVDRDKRYPTGIVDREKNVVWQDEFAAKPISADRLMIINYGEVIRLKFIRPGENKLFTGKNPKSIGIGFCKNGTRYMDVNEFSRLFKELSVIENNKVYRK